MSARLIFRTVITDYKHYTLDLIFLFYHSGKSTYIRPLATVFFILVIYITIYSNWANYCNLKQDCGLG